MDKYLCRPVFYCFPLWSFVVIAVGIKRLPSSKTTKKLRYVRFQVLTAASMKFRVFCDVALCNGFEVDRRQSDQMKGEEKLEDVIYALTR
jgi:hypothetical protein